jgi:hypothetical protein
MSCCNGRYSIQGKASPDLWDKYKHNILKPLKYNTEEEEFMCDRGFFTEEYSSGNASEESEDIIELDAFDEDNSNHGYNVGRNACFEHDRTDGAVSIDLQFNWHDNCCLKEYDTFIGRVKDYMKVDASSIWIWVSNVTTWRGGEESLPESGLNVGSIE